MQTIGVCGRKGGSGKTTTAGHIAAELASRGESVVLIDCDPQGSANHWSQPGNLPMPVQHRPISLKTDIEPLLKAIREVLSKTVDFLMPDSPPAPGRSSGSRHRPL